LIPARASELESARSEATFELDLDLSAKGDAKYVLQLLVNILRGTVVATEEKQSKVLLAKSLSDDWIVGLLRVEQKKVSFNLKCSNEELLGILAKEIDRRK
jgi:hypothetical protein